MGNYKGLLCASIVRVLVHGVTISAKEETAIIKAFEVESDRVVAPAMRTTGRSRIKLCVIVSYAALRGGRIIQLRLRGSLGSCTWMRVAHAIAGGFGDVVGFVIAAH